MRAGCRAMPLILLVEPGWQKTRRKNKHGLKFRDIVIIQNNSDIPNKFKCTDSAPLFQNILDGLGLQALRILTPGEEENFELSDL